MENGDEPSVSKGGGRLRRLVVHSLGAPPALAATADRRTMYDSRTHACLRGPRACIVIYVHTAREYRPRRRMADALAQLLLHVAVPDVRESLSYSYASRLSVCVVRNVPNERREAFALYGSCDLVTIKHVLL